MAKFDNLVEDLQKDHWELSNLAVFFKNALIISDRKKAGEILDKIDNLAKTHFEFEENYLYPRMLRLTRQVAEKLSAERSAINGFITKAKGSLKEARLHKGKISNLSKVAVLLSQHLKNCDDLVFLADKFSENEKGELYKKFKEYCAAKS